MGNDLDDNSMTGEANLSALIKNMTPELNDGAYVFITTNKSSILNPEDAICIFKEREGTSYVLEKQKADELNLSYDFVAAWITLTVHSSLEAVELTAAISTALAQNNISCNVIAAYYHDHLFVDQKDAQAAMSVLKKLSENL